MSALRLLGVNVSRMGPTVRHNGSQSSLSSAKMPSFFSDSVFGKLICTKSVAVEATSVIGSYVEYLQIDRSIEGGQDGRETKTMENMGESYSHCCWKRDLKI